MSSSTCEEGNHCIGSLFNHFNALSCLFLNNVTFRTVSTSNYSVTILE